MRRVIVDGDLKHEFGKISGHEWREVLDFLEEKGGEVILVKGNHDNIIWPVADRRGGEGG